MDRSRNARSKTGTTGGNSGRPSPPENLCRSKRRNTRGSLPPYIILSLYRSTRRAIDSPICPVKRSCEQKFAGENVFTVSFPCFFDPCLKKKKVTTKDPFRESQLSQYRQLKNFVRYNLSLINLFSFPSLAFSFIYQL